MRRALILALFFAAALLGQNVEPEGKAWLNSNTEPAQMNVNGAWHTIEWGLITLSQADGSRDVTGKIENEEKDNYVVSGVVSAKKMFLLFADKGHVLYSVELSPDGSSVLAGNYADGLNWKTGTRLIHMTKADAPDHPTLDPKAPQAHVVVYRAKDSLRRLKPSVYVDDQEAALTYDGYYFTVALSPGKHSLASTGHQYKPIALDAEPGATYYVRVVLSKEGVWIRKWFDVEQVDSATALKEMRL